VARVDHPELGSTRRETAPAPVEASGAPPALPLPPVPPAPPALGGWQKFDVISKAALTFAALILTGTVTWLTLDTNRQIADRQVESQRSTHALQRDLVAAQTVLELLPTLIEDAETRRTIVQEILARLAPEHLQIIANVQRARARSPDQQAQARQVLALAIEAQRTSAFQQHLTDGGTYLNLGNDAQAARAYLRAASLVPAHLKSAAFNESLSQGKALYDRHDFSSAAR
jgi:hypothetical protein